MTLRMYPDAETLRGVESENGKNFDKNSQLEKNCNQIFMRGPALTKEILGKVHAEIVPKKTVIFGHEFQTKRILLIAGLGILFSLSFLGATLTWYTNAFDDILLSQMTLTNNSESFNMWKKPSAKLLYKVYLFNYTNVDDYRNGFVKKLHLEEIGPYTFEEKVERINITFPTEDTISYREYRTHTFKPNLSKGLEDDLVVTPNIPVLGGSAFTKTQNYFNRLAFSGILSGLDEDAFSTMTVPSFVQGYNDDLYSLAKNFLPYESPEKIGLLVNRLGISPYTITINSGKNDVTKFAAVEAINGKKQFGYFSGATCDSIESTDGGLNPPHLVRTKQPLHFIFPEGCRRMPLEFKKETTILDGRVPAYQYSFPEDVFDSAAEKPENTCFCSGDKCPLKGLFNITVCNYNFPSFISHAHFHRGDPSLVKHFTGLHPEQVHKSYFNYHPTMGFLMSAKGVIQLNMQVKKASGVSQVELFEDDMILPIAWFEVVLDEKTLSQDILNLIDLLTFTIPTVYLALKYGCLLTAIVSSICLILVIRRKKVTTNPSPERLIRTNQGYYVAS